MRIQHDLWYYLLCQFYTGSIDMMANLLIQANKNHLISKIIHEERILQMKSQLFYGFLNYKLSFLPDNMLNDNSLILIECSSCVRCVCCTQTFYNVSKLSLPVLQFQLSIDGHDKNLLLIFDYWSRFSKQVSKLGICSFLSMCFKYQTFF